MKKGRCIYRSIRAGRLGGRGARGGWAGGARPNDKFIRSIPYGAGTADSHVSLNGCKIRCLLLTNFDVLEIKRSIGVGIIRLEENCWLADARGQKVSEDDN